jgi:hypothetical protein
MKVLFATLFVSCLIVLGFVCQLSGQCTEIIHDEGIPDKAPAPVAARPKITQTTSTTKISVKDGVTTTELDQTVAELPTPPTPPDEPKAANVKVTMPADGIPVKLVLDTDVDSGYQKNLETVAFSVMQDVNVFDEKLNLRCVVIPKDTKVYGIVDKSKGRHIFRIGGRAELLIYLEKITLDNGFTYPLHFSLPFAVPGDKVISKRKDKLLVPCVNHPSEKGDMCIRGRLTRTTVNPSILGSAAQGTVAFSDDKTVKNVARIGLAASILNGTGLSEVVNQSNASLRSKSVFRALLMPDKAVDEAGNGSIWRIKPKQESPAKAEKPQVANP